MDESATLSQTIVPCFSKLTLCSPNAPPPFKDEPKENLHQMPPVDLGLFAVAPKDRTPLTDKNQMSDTSFDIEAQEDFARAECAMKSVSLNLMRNFNSIAQRPFEDPGESLFTGNPLPNYTIYDDPVTPVGHSGLRSPNMRERCLMNDKMGHFAFNLPLPSMEPCSPVNDNSNPFKELSKPGRLPSEMDLSNYLVRADSSVQTPLSYSRSPILALRANSVTRFENFSEVSDNVEMPSLSKKDSVCSVSFADSESRFEKEFQVISELGKGHFGVIKKCRNRLDGLEYAVKVTKHKWKGERGKLEALQEVFALSALSVCDDNPYIVKYFNGWIEDCKLYIVVRVALRVDGTVRVLAGRHSQKSQATHQ